MLAAAAVYLLAYRSGLSPYRLVLVGIGVGAARALGVRLEATRLALVSAGVALAAVGVAAAGPVPFVAFVAPAIARRLTGGSVALIPLALVGALLVGCADLAARTVAAPTELPVGVITGVVGAPYLLWLLARANRGPGRSMITFR